MSIFGFGKKKEEQKQPCCCGGSCTPEAMQAAEAEKKESGIKILGGGCAKCNALEAATVDALRELGMDTTIDHVRDFEKIAAYGVMTTPALVVDGQVVSYGKVLKKDEVIVILKKVTAGWKEKEIRSLRGRGSPLLDGQKLFPTSRTGCSRCRPVETHCTGERRSAGRISGILS